MNPRCLLQSFKDDESVRFLQDPDVTSKLSNCKPLSVVVSSDYQAVFYVGGKLFRFSRPGVIDCRLTRRRFSAGYGPVVDLASDPINAALVSKVGLLSRPQCTWNTG